MTNEIAVISLGAGVQSTTLLLMACHGEIEPMPVEAIFADTGWEPKPVYDHLEYLRSVSTIPITTVSTGNIRDDLFNARSAHGKHFVTIPAYVRNEDGTGRGILRRQCTKEYKIVPIRRRQRIVMREHGAKRIQVMMGISLDESIRMRDSGVKYAINVYPLVDKRMTRLDCLNWLERNGYPRPPKSACIGCPYHNNKYWQDMKRNRPEEFEDACQFDEQIRRGLPRVNGVAFLHRQMIPLREVDMRTEEDKGQLSFLDECEGMCGV